jgi:hypothetical protein
MPACSIATDRDWQASVAALKREQARWLESSYPPAWKPTPGPEHPRLEVLASSP